MNINKIALQSAVALFATQLLIGCGSSSNDNTDNDAGGTLTKGYLIDSPIVGANYTCGDITGITIEGGEFACETTPVTFNIGGLTLGSISAFTPDTKVYPQDLLGLERTNFTDPDLIGLIRLLQSLDADGEIDSEIVIPEGVAAQFGDNANDLDWEALAALASITLISADDAITHLQGDNGTSQDGNSDDDNSSGNSGNNLVFNSALVENRNSLDDQYLIITCSDEGLIHDGREYDNVAVYEVENVVEGTDDHFADSGVTISVQNGKITLAHSTLSLYFEVSNNYNNYSTVKQTASRGGNTPIAGFESWSYWYKKPVADTNINTRFARETDRATYEGTCSETSLQSHITGNPIY